MNKLVNFLKRILRFTFYHTVSLNPLISNTLYVRVQYFSRYKRRLSVKYPQTLSEKLNAIKLQTPSALEVTVSDKVTVKDWVRALGYEDTLILTLDVVNDVDHLQWDTYPMPYIVKVSNGFDQYVVIQSRDDIAAAIKKMKKSLKYKHYALARESVYQYAKRNIIVEPFLTSDGMQLKDYKIYCFHGVPKFIQINDYVGNQRPRMMLDEHFERYPYPFKSGSESTLDMPPSWALKHMVNIAKDISSYFKFIRVDFYLYNDTIYIGELTLYPMGGYVLRNSFDYDQLWGSYLMLKP